MLNDIAPIYLVKLNQVFKEKIHVTCYSCLRHENKCNSF